MLCVDKLNLLVDAIAWHPFRSLGERLGSFFATIKVSERLAANQEYFGVGRGSGSLIGHVVQRGERPLWPPRMTVELGNR